MTVSMNAPSHTTATLCTPILKEGGEQDSVKVSARMRPEPRRQIIRKSKLESTSSGVHHLYVRWPKSLLQQQISRPNQARL